ncbi:MAG TPA: FecR domain-containing protein [Myxococcota bacterium]|nr:FecR domain-containing protein [Myxococcota bacterium]
MHVENRIDRYLAEGLPPVSAAKLKDHVRECDACRAHYDRQVALLRVLHGDVDKPTRVEDDRIVHLVLHGVRLSLSEEDTRESNRIDRLVWAPVPVLAVAAVMLLVLAFGFWQLASPADELAPAGTVKIAQIVKGRGVVVNGVRLKPSMKAETDIYANTRVEVGKNGIAEIKLIAGGTVRIYPKTSISFAPDGERLDLEIGRVWCLIDKRNTPFLVRTDTIEAWVIGTSFVVEREETGETEVRVMKGTVAVNDRRKPALVLVNDRQKTKVTKDAPPSRPVAYTPRRDKSAWDHFVEVLLQFFRQIGRAVEGLFE